MVVVGVRAVMGFTPELLAFALFGAGVLCWQSRRDGWAVGALWASRR